MENFTKNTQQGMSGQPAQQPAGQKTDYVDKAFDFVSKKAGHDMAPQTDEKITDGGRGVFEKLTG